MRLALFAAILSLTLAAPVRAQDGAPDVAAASRASAQAMIDRAGAGDLFVAEPLAEMPQFPRVRHLASGLSCAFSAQFGGEVVLFPSGLPRGDDVGCNLPTMFDQQSLYATRVSDGVTLDADFQMAVAALRQRFPGARAFTPSQPRRFSVLPMPDIERRRASFVTAEVFTHVSVAHIGGWAIKLRLTGPAATADLLDERADMAWGQTVRAVLEAQAAAAAASPPPGPAR